MSPGTEIFLLRLKESIRFKESLYLLEVEDIKALFKQAEETIS